MSSFLSHPCHGKCIYEPKDVADVMTYGFDPEINLKPSERAAKRRRIEQNAEIYSNGGQLAIASAFLKGPFGQGWVSPWQKYANLKANYLNGTDRSCNKRVNNNRKKRTNRKKPQEETVIRRNDVEGSNHRRRIDQQKSASPEKTKSLIQKCKNVSIGDKSKTDRGTKQKMVQGDFGAACQWEECNIGIEKENSPKMGTRRTSKNAQINKDRHIAHNMGPTRNKGNAGNTTHDKNDSELARKARSPHNCQSLTNRKPMVPKTMRAARSDDRTLQQDTVKKYLGSARKAISRIQLEEDVCIFPVASDVYTNENKRISMNCFYDVNGKPKQRNAGGDSMHFSDSTAPFALPCNESRDSNHLNEVYSEPAELDNHNKASSAVIERSRSSPISKSTTINNIREIGYDLPIEEVTEGCGPVHRNIPRYMTFNSPGLPPISADCGKKRLSTAKQLAQNSFNETKAHVDNGIINSHADKGEASSDQILTRTEAKETSLQTIGPRTTSEARMGCEIAAEVVRRDSPYGFKCKSDVFEHDKSSENMHRRISANHSSNVDFSTQKALVAAEEAFQNELIRKESFLVPNEEYAEAHLIQRNNDYEKPITPFANFRAKFDRSHSCLHPTPQMSTQELFEMVSPLAFSSATKSAAENTAYVASPPSKQFTGCEGSTPAAYHGDDSIPGAARQAKQLNIVNASKESSSHHNDVQVKASTKSGLQGTAFSISSNGLLHEKSNHAQQHDTNFEVEAVLDDANSFLQSWDLETELKGISNSIVADGERGKRGPSLSRRY